MAASLPPHKRLVLCADDYAQDAGVSRAVQQLAEQGVLTATSVMVLSPRWPEDAEPLRRWRGQMDVGLHLDFTSAFAHAAGYGMSLGTAMRRAALGGIDRGMARQAIEAQLGAFERGWGAAPDHVDGHQHVQQFAGIRQELVEALARRYGRGHGGQIPWLRISRAPASLVDFKSRVMAWMGATALQRDATAMQLPNLPWLGGIYDFRGDGVRYAGLMAKWLAAAPDHTVFMCHPSTGDDARGDDVIAAARQWEWAHLASPVFADQTCAAQVQWVRGAALTG